VFIKQLPRFMETAARQRSAPVTIEPARCNPPDISGGMACAGGNQQLFADWRPMASPAYLKFLLSLDNHYELIRIVDKIRPHPSWRIHPHAARKSTSRPLLPNLFLVECPCFISHV
jgi:hypothetical protein